MEYVSSLLGTSLGNYRLIRSIGHGSMGEVFEGEHILLGKRAAVKVLLKEMSNVPEAVKRFFNEARAAAKMRHIGLTEVFDFGYSESGSAYIVMELLVGETLADAVDQRGPLPVSEALAIAHQIAAAMASAHASGVVHRDLKPENIILVPDADAPGGVRLKVLDFGIAKLATETLFGGGTSSTSNGQIMGTPAFMAPEQCHGASNVDARADIYALGCILYHVLTGRPPFVSDGVGATIAAHLYEHANSPATLVPSIPAEVDALVMRLLEKAPTDRPGSMEEVDALLAAAAHKTPGIALAMAPTIALATLATTQPMTSLKTPTSRPLTTIEIASGSVETRPAQHKRRWIAAGAAAWAMVALLSWGWIGAADEGGGGVGRALAASNPAELIAPALTERAGARPVAGAAAAAGSLKMRMVTLRISSRPEGAEVVRASDGERLGATPLDLAVPAADATVALRVAKRGFRSEAFELSADRDGQAQIVLQRTAGEPPRSRARRVAVATTKTSSAPVASAARHRTTPATRGSVSVKDGALNPYGD